MAQQVGDEVVGECFHQDCRSGSPVRLRSGATATPMLGNRQGHRGFSESERFTALPRRLGAATRRSRPRSHEGRAGSADVPARHRLRGSARRAISPASAWVSASGVTPSSRCKVSAHSYTV